MQCSNYDYHHIHFVCHVESTIICLKSLEGSENQGSIETSSADHSPDNRRQNRKEHRDHYHQRRSRSHSRSRSRSRERDDFYRSRDRSWDHNGEYGDNYYDSHRSRRQEPPNHTIMLKGLGFHTEEKEV